MTDETIDPSDQPNTIPPDRNRLPGGSSALDHLGPFRIEGEIGAGGMGSVYRAWDESMRRTVALKVLHPSFRLSTDTQNRFAREAWIAGQFDHPSLITVYSRGEEKGMLYFAMEYADGGSLADEIRSLRARSRPADDTLSNAQVTSIIRRFIDLLRGLSYVHAKGFVHRDVKPHNILLAGPDRVYKLTDFGIAHADDMTRITRPGDFIGTIRYMSPELLAAHRATVDRKTDIYSMGVTLYEALTLALPYDGDTEERYISEILAGHAVPARHRNTRLSRDLETILLTAMDHDPARRYQSAEQFAHDLEAVLENRPITARREGLASRGLKMIRRNATPITVVGAAILVLAGILAALASRQRAAADHRRIMQTLQTVIATGAPASDLDSEWPRLEPKLRSLIQSAPLDSAVLLYYRSRCLLQSTNADFEAHTRSFMLMMRGADVISPSPPTDTLRLLVRCRLDLGVDTLPLEPKLVSEATYAIGGSGIAFIAGLNIDSLLTERAGVQYLHARLVSEHFRNARFFVPYSLGSPAAQKNPALPGELFITGTGDTLRLIGEGSSIGVGSVYPSLALTAGNLEKAVPLYTDTLETKFDIFVPQK